MTKPRKRADDLIERGRRAIKDLEQLIEERAEVASRLAQSAGYPMIEGVEGKDTSQRALRQVQQITGTKLGKGEDLLRSEKVKRGFLRAKVQSSKAKKTLRRPS